VRKNLDLLKCVRDKEPDAWIVFKTHPDEKNREVDNDLISHHLYCDKIVSDRPITKLYDFCDEVHTMTSTAGFEALLRGKSVFCYGQPFYSGWGLTTDYVDLKRRERMLSIEELVWGALMVYPRFYDPRKKLGCTRPKEQTLYLVRFFDFCTDMSFTSFEGVLRVYTLHSLHNPRTRGQVTTHYFVASTTMGALHVGTSRRIMQEPFAHILAARSRTHDLYKAAHIQPHSQQ
jgi:hypothetical protein